MECATSGGLGNLTPVPASRALLTDTSMFPSDAEMARYFTIGPVPQAAERQRTRLWAAFKAGN